MIVLSQLGVRKRRDAKPTMSNSATRWALAAVLLLGAIIWGTMYYRGLPTGTVDASTVIDVSAEPKQGPILAGEPIEIIDGDVHAFLTPVAEFRISARVLSTCRYSEGDRLGEVSPIDLALGWGIMSQDGLLKQLRITQNNRWFSFRSSNSKLPYADIQRSATNLHAIPANDNIRRALLSIRKDDLILFDGELVNVYGSHGKEIFEMKTSRTRDDGGAGACEIMRIETVIRDGKIYR